MKRFALIGAAGYVAPRHLEAIRDIGGDLIAALDPHDSVGILDSFFPKTEFFTKLMSFERYLDKLRHADRGVDYISICSPNHLHNLHLQSAFRLGADAICEKPLVLTPQRALSIAGGAKALGRRVNTIMQLRLHPAIVALKGRIDGASHDIVLNYITPRGRWYHSSWKADPAKSGGLVTNIGIHLFDLLLWLFGGVRHSAVHIREATRASGVLDLKRARVNWFLSIQAGEPQRSITIDGEEIEFSTGLDDLHTESYQRILDGRGFTVKDVLPSIRLASAINDAELQ